MLHSYNLFSSGSEKKNECMCVYACLHTQREQIWQNINHWWIQVEGRWVLRYNSLNLLSVGLLFFKIQSGKGYKCCQIFLKFLISLCSNSPPLEQSMKGWHENASQHFKILSPRTDKFIWQRGIISHVQTMSASIP